MRNALIVTLLSCSLFLAACSSSPVSIDSGQEGVSSEPSGTSETSRPRPAKDEMSKLLDSGRAAVDSNHLTEGIRAFVAVMALGETERSPEGARLAAEAEAELVRIGTRLSLEPGEAWVSPDGKQISGSCRSIGKEGALQPSVYLFENWGSGKSPIPDAPIRFEFVRGGGVLTASAATDMYGRANAALSRLDSPSSEAVVRAYPSFTVRGFTYSFKAVQRDFAYLPPSNLAKIVALERGPEGVSANPQVLDAVASVLKEAGLETAPLNGKLLGADFDRAFSGDPAALRTLSASAGASYFAFVLSEASPPRQMEYGGKKYNIFSCDCKSTLRLVRDDGTIVYALPLTGIKGQGGTAQAAVSDSFAKARESLVSRLNGSIGEIRRSLEN